MKGHTSAPLLQVDRGTAPSTGADLRKPGGQVDVDRVPVSAQWTERLSPCPHQSTALTWRNLGGRECPPFPVRGLGVALKGGSPTPGELITLTSVRT
jgi:hypothetical protein